MGIYILLILCTEAVPQREFLLVIQCYLYTQGLNVVTSISSAGEVRKVELDLVPPIIQTHGHGADERLHTGGGLVIGGPEPPTNILVVQNLKQHTKKGLHQQDI